MIGQKGFALVLVLWVLSLLTIMAGSFALSMRRESAIVTGGSRNAQAVAIAESGLAIAELMLMVPEQRQRWRTDGSLYQIGYAESKVRIRLFSEAGKVDLNSADQELLQGLMAHAAVDAQMQTKLVNAILDWRDADDLVHIEGAEEKEYKEAGLSYQPRNKPFQSIEELQLVLGMDERIFKRLENLVTVYSGQSQVDVTQAAEEVLHMLPGMDAGLIDEYIAARRESAVSGLSAPAFSVHPAGQAGAGAAIARDGVNAADQPEAGAATGTAVNGAAGQKGAVTVLAEALLADGTTAMIKALIKKSDSTESPPFHILKWQRDAVGDGSLFTDEKDALLVRQYAGPEFDN